MKLGEGLEYELVNRATTARARFILSELHLYNGCYVCLGYSSRHQERVYKGIVETPERLSAFVPLPEESLATVATLIEGLLGQPLVVRAGREELPILNMANIPGYWSGLVSGPGAREGLLRAQQAKVDLYRYWKEHNGELPLAFLQARAIHRGYGAVGVN